MYNPSISIYPVNPIHSHPNFYMAHAEIQSGILAKKRVPVN